MFEELSFSEQVDVLRLFVSIATPICVVTIAFILNKRLKSIDESQWQSRKIVERRLEIYDYVAPRLNGVFCFMMGFGDWKEISPPMLIDSKRELDKHVNVYRHLLSEEFYQAYDEFIHATFETFTGRGKDAKIKALVDEEWGNRQEHGKYDWKPEFEGLFSDATPSTKSSIQSKYIRTMDSLRRCIGI